jgi:hypothetical protein
MKLSKNATSEWLMSCDWVIRQAGCQPIGNGRVLDGPWFDADNGMLTNWVRPCVS